MPSGGTISFSQLWLNALDRFTRKTGVDPLKHKLAHSFSDVQSLDQVFAMVETHMKDFKAFRAPGSRWDELREKYFKPIVRALLVVTEAAGELASDLQVPGGKTIFVVFAILLQATKGISKRYDAVLDVFEALNRYLDRLSVRLLDARGKMLLLGTATRKLAIDTLEHLLDIIALAVKLLKHRRCGRLVHYAQSLGCIGGQDDMEGALARLKELAEYEMQATAAETYVAATKIQTTTVQTHFQLKTFVDSDILTRRLGRVEPADIVAQDDPCCMLGTRVDLLNELNGWSLDADAPRIFWLDGLAGTGKSAIARSLSHLLRKDKRLGGSFFCSRVGTAERRDIKRVIPTLASSMALVIPGFKEYLLQALSKSFVSYHSNLGEQMQHIIKNPFGHIENDRLRTVVLIVDALDECTDEALTKEFLTCIINASHYLPIKIFVTSRPERHIRAQFLSLSPEYRVLRLHEIDPGIVKADISTYLTNSLADVSRERSDLVPPDWPSAEDVRRLVDRAGSLFIYAFTAVKYIGEDPVGNLQALFSTGCFAEMTNLEELYTQILTKSMTRKSREQVVTIRRILTAILVACKPLSIPTLSTWLDVDAYRIRSMLDQLHSVIRMPGDDDGTVSIFHASFGEFLTSSQHVPSDVRVLLSKGHCHFAKRCFKIMHSDLHFNVSQSLSSYQPTELLPDTSVVTSTTHDVPWQLQYACQYWLDHVIDASVAIQDVDSLLHHLELFLRKKLLYWIEALLAMGLLNNCIQMLMRSLGTPVLLQKMSPSLTSFLRDASEFVILSRDAIKHSPPHIYLSAIPFARPTSSVVHENALRFACLPLPNVRGLTRARVPILLLRAHSGAVNAVAVSPDGNYIASGAGDKSVCKWSSGTGELVDQLKGHTGEVLSIAYSPDASQIASGSSDCTIRIWDARTGECTLVITRHTASVMSVMFSNSGAQVISGSKDKTVLISNVQDGQPFLSPLEGHDEAVTCVAISRDGELIASGSEDCTIRLWNAKTGTPALQPLKGHDFAVQSVAFSPDGTRIISGSRDWRINVWNSSSGECLIAPLKEHSNNVNSVAFAPDDKHIASCSDDRTILVWDVDTGGLVMQPIVGHTDPVLSLAFSPDGKRLVSGSADRTISVWAVSNDDRPSNPLEGHTKAVYSVVFSSDGKRILSGSADRTVRIWDACTGKPVMKPLSGHTDDVNCAVFSKDGMQIASCADDHTIRIWNANSGEPDTTMPIITGHTQWVWSVEFSLDGKHIVSASKDKTVHIWDTATGKPVVSLLECHKHEVKWAVLSPDGKRIASASFDSTICVWSAETGELLLGPLTGHIGWIWALAYSSDGRRIASGGEDNKIRIWDAQTGELLWTLDGHTDDVFAVSFSPDSLFIVSGSADCTVCLWDVEKGALVGQPLLGHTDTVRCIAFAPNGRHAVSGSADTTIRVWDLYLVSAESLLRRTNEMVNSTSSALRLPGTSGWIRGPQGERRMWVLPEYRAFVHDKDLMPQCVLLIATGRVTVNFKDSVHGEEWTKCHVSEM